MVKGAMYVGMVELDVPPFVVQLILPHTYCRDGEKNKRVHRGLEAAVT